MSQPAVNPSYGGGPPPYGVDTVKYPPIEGAGSAYSSNYAHAQQQQQPPPPSYTPGYSTAQPVVVHQQPVQTVIVQPTTFRDSPVQMTCPRCSQNIVTRLGYDSGLLTWIICGVLVFFGCIFGCCLIPFCVDGTKDVRHMCPSCGATLGVCRRI